MADKLRVLVVDDDDLVRTQIATLLSGAKHLVHQLPSAIGVTRTIMQNRIEVVVVDVMMPSLSGDKLAVLLRQNARLSSLVVVLVSSRPVAELERLASEVGADMVASKADLKMSFVTSLEQAVDRRRRRQVSA